VKSNKGPEANSAVGTNTNYCRYPLITSLYNEEKVKHYLEVVHRSLEPIFGFLTNLFIGNLDDGSNQSINIRWSEFDKAIQSGSEITDIDEAVGK